MTDSPDSTLPTDVDTKAVPPEEPISGWQQRNSNTVIVRQLTDEQLATYRETGAMPASADIPLVEVTDVASLQPPPGTPGFNGSRKTSRQG